MFVPSILRQYLVVVFRDKPLELWDIRTGTLLREMAKNFPTVTALVQKPICLLRPSIRLMLLWPFYKDGLKIFPWLSREQLLHQARQMLINTGQTVEWGCKILRTANMSLNNTCWPFQPHIAVSFAY